MVGSWTTTGRLPGASSTICHVRSGCRRCCSSTVLAVSRVQAQRIRSYLGLRSFDREAEAELRDWLRQGALEGRGAACRAFNRLEERGHLDAMLARYATLRQYLPAFVALPFQASVGSEPLMTAIGILRELDADTGLGIEPTDPRGFVPAAWRPFLMETGAVDRRIWEIALALAIRDALRAGNLFLTQSREHVSFWNLIHDERSWQEGRGEAYRQLNLPSDPCASCARP